MNCIKALWFAGVLFLTAKATAQPAVLPAKVDVSAIGAATYTIPIEVVPGTNGLQPNLAIVYNSMSGMGVLGQKWSLQGISSITRVPQSKYFDGNITAIGFDTTDRFALNGSRMLLSSGNSYHDNPTYCLETEDFSRIKKQGYSYDNLSFKRILPDGKEDYYGAFLENDSRLFVDANVKAIAWMIDKTIDAYGNSMDYYYQQSDGEIWIERIVYTRLADNTPAYASVEFEYEEAVLPNDGYVQGYHVRQSRRLKSIVIKYQEIQVRKYQFSYDASMQYERLTEIALYGADDALQTKTTIDWYTPTGPMTSDVDIPYLDNNYSAIAGNFDDDRLYDIFAVNRSTSRCYLIRKAADGTYTSVEATDHLLSYASYNELSACDLDGDGVDEVIYYVPITSWYYYIKLNEQGSSPLLQSIPKRLVWGDFDGDGIVEPVAFNGNSISYRFVGESQDIEDCFFQNHYEYCHAGDFNGDGKTDLLFLLGLQSHIYTFDIRIQRWVLIEEDGFPNAYQYLRVGDFNGDGMSDLLFLPNNSYIWNVAIRHGKNNWTLTPVPELDGTHLILNNNSYNPLYNPVICDINGDGKSDIIQPEDDNAVRYIISDGCLDDVFNYSEVGSFALSGAQDLDDSGCSFGDFDGNGIDDILFSAPTSGTRGSIKYFHEGILPGYFAKRMIDAAGKITKFEYGSISMMPGRYSGTGMNRVPFPLVRNMTVTNGIDGIDTTRFYYGDAQYDADRHQFIGFAQFGMENNRNISETFFSRVPKDDMSTFAFLMPDSVVNYVAPARLPEGQKTYSGVATHLLQQSGVVRVAKTQNANSSKYRTNADGNISFLPFVSENKQFDYLKNSKKTIQTSLHDVYWRPSQQTTKYSNIPNLSNEIVREYVNNTYSNVTLHSGTTIVMPTQIVTTHYNSAAFVQPRCDTVSFTYSDRGSMLTQRHTDNCGQDVRDTVTYDFTGAPTSIKTTPRGGQSRTFSHVYDPSHRFAVRTSTNTGETTQKTFNPATGVCLSETDINSLITQYSYDGLGRLTQVAYPDGTTKAITYTNTSGGMRYACCFTTVTESGKPETRTYYDCLGRKNHTYVGGQGYMDIQYNKLGQVARQTVVPYANASLPSSSKKWRRYTYDDFGRLVKDSSYYQKHVYTYGLENFSGHHYNSAEDKRGAVSTNYYDAANRLVEVQDEGGGITYLYDRVARNGIILDRMRVVSEGNTTTILTDSRGNRVQLVDPDAGTISCTYDAWGRLLSQTDGKGDVTETSFDVRGWLRSRDYIHGENVDNVYIYNYGTSAPSIGKVTEIYDNYVLRQSFSYDNVGRLSSTTKYIGGNAYTHQYTYNSNGQIYTIQYPSGFAVRYEYDVYGRLKHVKNHTSGAVIYTVDHRNDLGQPTRCWFGNETGVEYTYDLWGLTTKIQYGHKELVGFRNDPGGDPPPIIFDDFSYYVGNQYSVLQYTYDDNGFITRKRDTKTSQQEDFSYDDLGRLTSFTVNNTLTHDFVYEDNGNIGANSLVGSCDYAYDADRPHAVTGVVSETGNIPSAQCDVTYNSRNRPATISEDGWSLELSYGSGLQREKTVLKQGNSIKRTTYHISKDCELDILPACTCSRYMDYIFADGKIVAIHVHNTAANADSMYYVQTDLLGSWDRIVDDGRSVVQSSHFDPWGNRKSTSDWTVSQDGSGFGFRRGFTGHEHYDRFGIINMNARLYDPIIGRFFSPDPQVQNPYSTQGLNRYSYCGNNPVMNIDPDGEFLISMVLFAGITNYVIHNNQGDVSNAGDRWGYFGQGALAGLIKGLNWINTLSLISLGSPTGMAIVNAKTLSILSTGLSMIKDFSNASSIFFGKYYFDENMAHGYSQALTRFTTESLQTWVGYNSTQIRNLCGYVDRVDYLGGATFATYENNGHDDKSSWGITLGNFINISLYGKIDGDFKDDLLGRQTQRQLFMHEYGHTIQSQMLGLSYLFIIGIPSLISAANNKEIENDPYSASTHDYFFSETWANRLAANFFKNFGYTWSEIQYPFKDYR